MTKDEFIALHGEEAFQVFCYEKLNKVEYYVTVLDPFQQIHDHIIMPMLKIMGFPEAKGLLEVKEKIMALQQWLAQSEPPLSGMEVLMRFAQSARPRQSDSKEQMIAGANTEAILDAAEEIRANARRQPPTDPTGPTDHIFGREC